MVQTFAGFDSVAVDPEILGGAPHVRGTRISVQRALEVLAQYSDRERLRDDYPGLDDDAIACVLRFAAATLGGRVVPLNRTAA